MAEVQVTVPDVILTVKGLVAGDIIGSWSDNLETYEVDISGGGVASFQRFLKLSNPNAVEAVLAADLNWQASSASVVQNVAILDTFPLTIAANGEVELTVEYTLLSTIKHGDTVVISGGGLAVTSEA